MLQGSFSNFNKLIRIVTQADFLGVGRLDAPVRRIVDGGEEVLPGLAGHH